MRTHLIIFLISISLILAACGTDIQVGDSTIPSSTTTAEPESAASAGPVAADGRFSVAAGQAFYVQLCIVCHGESGQGDGSTASVLDPKPANFTDRELRDSRTPADRFDIISNGVADTGMPAWGSALDEDERWAVLYYTWSLANNVEEINAGQQIFEANCVVCHGPGGRGDGEIAENLEQQPANFTDHEFMASRSDEELFNVITNGKNSMPVWGEVLSEDQRWQVIAFLRTFTYQPAQPGMVFAEPTTRPEGAPLSFQQDVLPILVTNCARCHSGASPPNGLRLVDYKTVMKGSLFLPILRPGDPEASPLYLMISKGTMPANGQPLNQAQVQIIFNWIAAGALDN